MGAIIARFLESLLLLETGRTLTITSRIIVISHSASPPTASLLLKSGNIPRGSSSFSTTISLQRNASERTTFFVSGSYLVQKSHGMQTPSSIRSCVNCSSSRSACLHMMPSREAFSPSMLRHHWLWRHSRCFHAHAHERTQWSVSLSNVQHPSYSHSGLVKQDALRAAVPLQSSHADRCCRV